METRNAKEQLWKTMASGLVIPVGSSSELTLSSSQTYLQIKEKAGAIEKMYKDSAVPLPPTCDLANLIADAKILSDSWFMDKLDNTATNLMFRVSFLDRIADAILPLSNVAGSPRYLKVLTSGSLDLLKRTRSLPKDILWELELWSILQRRSFNSTLVDPPDITVEFEGAIVGISCKKFYSERNVEKVLSEAVAQIEATCDFGILAVNIDDLVPPDQILRAPTQQVMGQIIHELNVAFLRRHERHFKKYLASGRVLSVFVSTSLLADIATGTRFNIAKQATIWTMPGLPPEKLKQLERFYSQFMSGETSQTT